MEKATNTSLSLVGRKVNWLRSRWALSLIVFELHWYQRLDVQTGFLNWASRFWCSSLLPLKLKKKPVEDICCYLLCMLYSRICLTVVLDQWGRSRVFSYDRSYFTGQSACSPAHRTTCRTRLSLYISICPPPIFCLYLTDWAVGNPTPICFV